jgi:hypothetical protein
MNTYKIDGYNNFITESGYVYTDVDDSTRLLFSNQHLNMIQSKITQLLDGVHPEGKNIVVTTKNISSVLYSIYNNNRSDNTAMTDTAIELICENVRTEFITIKQNNKLNIWDTVFDGTKGMRQHPPIKLRERRPASMQNLEGRY